VLSRDILFGMDILTLVGFVMMWPTLTRNRTGHAGKPLPIGLMAVETARVFGALRASGWPK
jgi:hypothetical protein